MSSQVARRVVEEFQKPAPSEDPSQKLTDTEMELLQLLARGLLYKEIAERLQIGVAALTSRIHRIYDKLHVRSRSEAVLKLPRRETK